MEKIDKYTYKLESIGQVKFESHKGNIGSKKATTSAIYANLRAVATFYFC